MRAWACGKGAGGGGTLGESKLAKWCVAGWHGVWVNSMANSSEWQSASSPVSTHLEAVCEVAHAPTVTIRVCHHNDLAGWQSGQTQQVTRHSWLFLVLFYYNPRVGALHSVCFDMLSEPPHPPTMGDKREAYIAPPPLPLPLPLLLPPPSFPHPLREPRTL